MASTHAPDSMKFEVPRWAVYLIAAVLVLAAAYILGSTLKERVTDPVIDGVSDSVQQKKREIESRPEQEDARAEAVERVAEMYMNAQYLTRDQVDVRSISYEVYREAAPEAVVGIIPWDQAESAKLQTLTVSTDQGSWIVATWKIPGENKWHYTTDPLHN